MNSDMWNQLLSHAGTGVISGLAVAMTAFLRARAKREETTAEIDKAKAATDGTVIAHLIANVEAIKTELDDSRRRHEECERRNADCDRNFAQLRHEFEIFRGSSMVPPPALPPRRLP